jgi:hypothetical protein
MEALTLVIAALALLLSVYVYLRQRAAEGRASFVADWVDHQTLVLVNLGPGSARNVTTDLPGNAMQETREISHLPPRHPVRMFVIRPVATQLGDLTVNWSDARRAHQSVALPISEPPRPPERPQVSGQNKVDGAIRNAAREEARRLISDQLGGFGHNGLF